MAFLTSPAMIYRESYLAALREFQAEGRNLNPAFEEVATDFQSFVQHLLDRADCSKLKPGRVPSTEFWLIDEGNYIGSLSLRHELNENLLDKGGHIGYKIRPSCRRQRYGTLILKRGLGEARALGLELVLLTCDEDNIGSRKVIEANGGKLENIIQVNGWPKRICRYWITIAKS